MSHATLSEHPLKGRVRFDMEILAMDQYLQIGVCSPDIHKLCATVGTLSTWVLYMYDTALAAYSDGRRLFPTQRPPVLHDRFGFAYDEMARTLICYRDGEKPVLFKDVRAPVHACALLGGKNISIRLHPASKPYPFTCDDTNAAIFK
jgi:hypothetical protein